MCFRSLIEKRPDTLGPARTYPRSFTLELGRNKAAGWFFEDMHEVFASSAMLNRHCGRQIPHGKQRPGAVKYQFAFFALAEIVAPSKSSV